MRKHKIRRVLLGLLWVFLSTILKPPLSIQPGLAAAQSAEESWIAYIGADGNLWIVHPDGSDNSQITADASSVITYSSPSWAPDGTQIAVASQRDGNVDIHLLNLQGDHVQRITDHPARDQEPAWSPDGLKIAFVSDRDGNQDIYVAAINGESAENVTNHPGEDYQPAWAPDGTQIVFTSSREATVTGIPGLYFLSLETGNVIPYISGGGLTGGKFPIWSPNGQQIAYVPVYPECCGNVVIGDLINTWLFDVSELHNIAACPTGNCLALAQESPTWSADGQRMAYELVYYEDFINWEIQNTEIRVTNLASELPGTIEGQNSLMIAHGREPAWWPAYSAPPSFPSDSWIAFIGEDKNIWLIRPDGSGLKQVTTDATDTGYRNLKWSPDGKSLGFTRESNNSDTTEFFLMRIDSLEVISFPYALGPFFDWSPDGNQIVYSERAYLDDPIQADNGLWVFDLTSEQITLLLPDRPEENLDFGFPDWSPDGEQISFSLPCFEPQCIKLGIISLRENQILPQPNINEQFGISGCEWKPDSSQIACSLYTSEGYVSVILLDATENEITFQLPTRSNWSDGSPAWAPDGTRIALSTYSPIGNLSEVYTELVEVGTWNRKRLTTGVPLDWSPDGNWLLVQDNLEIYITHIETGNRNFLTKSWQGIATWQPGTSPVQNVDALIERKNATISALEHTEFQTWGGTQTEEIEAFDENPAKALIASLGSSAALTPEQLAAFDRLVLQEEALARILPHQTIVARNMSESMVDFLGLAWSTGELLKGAAPKSLEELVGSMLLEIIEAYAQISEDSTIQGVVGEGAELFLATLTAENDGDLEGVIVEVILGNLIRKDATTRFVERYVTEINPVLTQSVNSVLQEQTPYWSVQGSPQGATLQLEHLSNLAQLANETSTSMLEDIRKGSEVNDVFMEIGDLATTYSGGGMPWLTTVSIVSRVFDAFLIMWGDTISQKAYTCIYRVSAATGEKAFNPSSELITCPELEDLDSIPPWLENIFELPFFRETSTNLGQLTVEINAFNAAVASEDLEEIRIAYDNLQKAEEALLPKVDTIQKLVLAAPDREVSTTDDRLILELLKLKMHLALIDLAAEGILSEGAVPAEIKTLVNDRAQQITPIRDYLREIFSTMPTSSEHVDFALPVLSTFPEGITGVEGQKMSLGFSIRNFGSLPSEELTLIGSIAGQPLFTEQVASLPPDIPQAVMASFQAPQAGDYWLTIQMFSGERSQIELIRVLILPNDQINAQAAPIQARQTILSPFSTLLNAAWFGPALCLTGLGLFSVGLFGFIKLRSRKRPD